MFNFFKKPKPDYTKVNALTFDLLNEQLYKDCVETWTTKLCELREKRAKMKLDWSKYGISTSAVVRDELELEVVQAEGEIQRCKRDRIYNKAKRTDYVKSMQLALLVGVLTEKGFTDILTESKEKALLAALAYFDKYPEDVRTQDQNVH